MADSLTLHDGGRAALIGALEGVLSRVAVNQGRNLDYASLTGLEDLDTVFPGEGGRGQGLRARFEKVVGDDPASTFVLGYLTRRLRSEREHEPGAAPAPLVEVLGTSVETLSVEIVQALESLPWEFVLATRLPDPLAEALAGVELSRDLEIAPYLKVERSGGELHWPPLGLLGFRTDLFVESPKAPSLLRYSGSGFVQDFGDSPLLSDARETTLAFAGVGISLGLITLAPPTFGSLLGSHPRRSIQVFEAGSDGGGPDHLFGHSFSGDVAQFMDRLAPGVLFDNDLDALSIAVLRKSKLRLLRAAFTPSEQTRIVRRGAQWLAESLVRGAGDLLSFIQRNRRA